MSRRSSLSKILLLVTACGGPSSELDATAVERAVLTELTMSSPLGARTLGRDFAFEWTIGLELAGDDAPVSTLVAVLGVAEEGAPVTRDMREFDHCLLGSLELPVHASAPSTATERGVFTVDACTREPASERLRPFVLVGPALDMTLSATENRDRFQAKARLLLGGDVVAPHCETGSDPSCGAPVVLDPSNEPTPFIRNLAVPEVLGALPAADADFDEFLRAHLEATAEVGVWGRDGQSEDLPSPLIVHFFVRYGDVVVPLRVESRHEDPGALMGDPTAQYASRLHDGLRLESHELPDGGASRLISAALFFSSDASRGLQSETLSISAYQSPPQQLIACVGPADETFDSTDIDVDDRRCATTELLLLSSAERSRLQALPATAGPQGGRRLAAIDGEEPGKSQIPSYSECIDRIPDWYQCAPFAHSMLRPLQRSRGSSSIARAHLSMGPSFNVGRSAQLPADGDIKEVTDLLVSPCGPFVTMHLMSLDTPCPLTIVTMKMGADISASGKHIPDGDVFSASARGNITIDEDQSAYTAVAELSLFGHQLAYHAAPTGDSNTVSEIAIPGFSDLPYYSKRFCKEGDHIHKWGVDMSFDVCVRGTVGLDGDGTLYVDTVTPDDGGTSNHTLGDALSSRWEDSTLVGKGLFRAHVTPYANIDLVAEAGGSASIVSLSLNGTIDLADFRLSDHQGSSHGAAADLLVGLRMDDSEDPPRPVALVHQYGSKAYLHGSFLDGDLSLHARVDLGFWKPHHTWKLASWNGFDWYRKLYDEVSDFDSVNLSGSD